MHVRMATARDADAVAAYAAAHPHATPFHRAAWMDAVARACRQKSHLLIAIFVPEQSRGVQPSEVEAFSAEAPNASKGVLDCALTSPWTALGKVMGILPLHEIHSPLFGRALVSTGFAVGGGILADDQATADALGASAWALAQSLSCPTLELRGGMLPTGWDRDRTTYLGFARALAADDDAELLTIPRKQRAEVRRALGFDLTIDLGDCDAHYHVYSTSVRNLGTPVFPRALFDAVLGGFGTDADVLTVRRDGQPLASVLSLYHRSAEGAVTVMPYWGGGTAEARTWRANDLMYFALMRHARQRGCTRFDFGRSKAGTGAAAFKRNWGFEGEPLAYARRSVGVARSVNPLDPKYSLQVKLWQKLPLGVANRIGPLVARGLG